MVTVAVHFVAHTGSPSKHNAFLVNHIKVIVMITIKIHSTHNGSDEKVRERGKVLEVLV